MNKNNKIIKNLLLEGEIQIICSGFLSAIETLSSTENQYLCVNYSHINTRSS